MVDRISAEQAYMDQVMTRTPVPQRGETYQIKTGDSLWKIAKKELASSNASKGDIQNLVYQIAKLNNMTTVEQMNNLKTSDNIILPKAGSSSAKTAPSKVSNTPKTQKTNGAAPSSQVKKQNPTENSTHVDKVAWKRESSEKSLLSLMDQLKTDKTINLRKMYSVPGSPNELYHVYCRKNDPNTFSGQHVIMSFVVDKKSGRINEVSFNDQSVKRNKIMYDYDLDVSGNIVSHDDKNINGHITKTKHGKLNPNELNELQSLLNGLLAKNSGV